jgi:hypothetical protein
VAYGDLQRIAVCHARRFAAHPTLQPTMLIHEAWLRLYCALSDAGEA